MVASLVCSMEPKKNPENKVIKRTKNKNRDAQKKQSGHEVTGINTEAGGQYMVERLVTEVGFEPGVKQ